MAEGVEEVSLVDLGAQEIPEVEGLELQVSEREMKKREDPSEMAEVEVQVAHQTDLSLEISSPGRVSNLQEVVEAVTDLEEVA